MSFTKVDEREKQAALEEEQARLKALKVTNQNLVKYTGVILTYQIILYVL